MWVQVLDHDTGEEITNATFSVPFGTGRGYSGFWYYVYVGPDTTFYVSAPGYHGHYINSDAYGSYYVWLAPAPPLVGGW